MARLSDRPPSERKGRSPRSVDAADDLVGEERAGREQRPELRARVDPELLVHATQDVADRLRGEEGPLRDFAVAQPGRGELRDAALRVGQALRRMGPAAD